MDSRTYERAPQVKVTIILTTVVVATWGLTALSSPMPMRWSAIREPASSAPTKKETLAKLKILQDKQIAESTELENAIRKQLNETIKLSVGNDDLKVAGRRTNIVTKKIDELNKRRNELNARREIVDRLIFQVDSKWDGKTPLKDFLQTVFIEMASTDLSDGRDNRLWKEFTFLSMVMREVPEKNEDVIALFEGYLNYSSVLDPKTPADFMASRNYTNGLESAQARANERSSIGDGIGPSSTGQQAPIQIRTSLGIPEAPSANLAEPDATVSATTQPPPAATPAPTPTPGPTPIAHSKEETAEKAMLDSGQVPMSRIETAGKADSPDAAPLLPGNATRAGTSTKATQQSAENLKVHAEKSATPAPRRTN